MLTNLITNHQILLRMCVSMILAIIINQSQGSNQSMYISFECCVCTSSLSFHTRLTTTTKLPKICINDRIRGGKGGTVTLVVGEA